VIFSTKEFKLIELDDSIATGSSIMPQKKNPDVCELLRAKSAKAMGSLLSGLALLKGLPSSYNRDLQELKPILFRQVKETEQSLYIARLVLQKCKFNDKGKDWAKTDNTICVTDLIDHFVKTGYRFREIYNIVGECVKESGGDMNRFRQMLSERIKVDSDVIAQMLTPEFSIKNKVSDGGTGNDAVRKSLKKMAYLIKKESITLNNINP
jgi:argininosuccinate lyase